MIHNPLTPELVSSSHKQTTLPYLVNLINAHKKVISVNIKSETFDKFYEINKNNLNEIETGSLENGIYLIQITGKNSTISKKEF